MWFILFGLIVVGLTAWIITHCIRQGMYGTEAVLATLFCLAVGGFLGFGLAYGMTYLTTGLFPDYSYGTREGYVTKLSVKGVIWQTNEGEMQIGAGEMAALQVPYVFSCPDDETWQALHEVTGKRVRLHYRQWLIMPARIGESGYEIVKVEVLDE